MNHGGRVGVTPGAPQRSRMCPPGGSTTEIKPLTGGCAFTLSVGTTPGDGGEWEIQMFAVFDDLEFAVIGPLLVTSISPFTNRVIATGSAPGANHWKALVRGTIAGDANLLVCLACQDVNTLPGVITQISE